MDLPRAGIAALDFRNLTGDSNKESKETKMPNSPLPPEEPSKAAKLRERMDGMTDSLLRGAGVLGLAGALILGAVTLLLRLKPEVDIGVRSLSYVALPLMGLTGVGLGGLAAWHLTQAFTDLEQWAWPNGPRRVQARVAFGFSCVIALSIFGLLIAALLSLQS